MGRDPWFDILTTLSEVDPSTKLRVDAEQSGSIEGESRKIRRNQIILDLPPKAAGDDELRPSREGGGGIATFFRIHYN